MAAQVHGFQTEVTKLLKLLANSLYSNKEIFLRELISNASDAVDKLRFLSIQDPLLTKDDPLFHIRVKADEAAGTLTISDNGIGMTLDEANEHLGTIAKSGTEEFFRNLSQDQAKASQLIGQFGVGFYSAFIVADRVTVVSRSAKAAANEAVRWTSDGNGTYESELTTKDTRGTDVILTLKDSEKEFLNEWTLRGIITKYSDHISTPVWLWEKETPADEKKEPTWKWVQVNDAKALWTLPPKDVKDEQYKEFYKHLTHDYDDPLTWAHNRVEGDLEYTSLLYIPKTAPWDLYNREQKNGLKLYVQRVFIMDNAEEFLPNYLRFVKGLVDTADLPLNVSREILQDSAVTRKLRRALTKRALTMIGKLAEDKTKYAEFWSQFGRVLKEGPVEDRTNQEEVRYERRRRVAHRLCRPDAREAEAHLLHHGRQLRSRRELALPRDAEEEGDRSAPSLGPCGRVAHGERRSVRRQDLHLRHREGSRPWGTRGQGRREAEGRVREAA